MADKLRTQQQIEALQAKHIGTGHADTTRHEWTTNVQRDTKVSLVGHPALLDYYAMSIGEPKEVARMKILEEMVRPVGPAPRRDALQDD